MKNEFTIAFLNAGIIMLNILRSIWSASITIISGIAYIFLLIGLVNYFGLEAPQGLLEVAGLMLDYWDYFWWTAFVLTFMSRIEYSLIRKENETVHEETN
jgi:hypothetical protein